MNGDRSSDENEVLDFLDETVETELIEALRSAYDPAPLSERRHATLIELALEDPFAPPTEDELVESERLRRALDDDRSEHPDVVLARALRAALEPESGMQAQALPFAAGVASEPGSPGAGPTSHENGSASSTTARAPRRSNLIYVAFGAAGAISALAAGLMLLIQPAHKEQAAASARPQLDELAQSRSTGELFSHAFERRATTSRIDRIARARQQDLRENRYATWGVR